MTTRVNGNGLRHARLSHNLTLQHVADLTGISSAILTRLEANDPKGPHLLTLHQARQLAEAIGLHPSALYSAPGPSTTSDKHDLRQLARVLIAYNRAVSPQALSRALNWKLDRLHQARVDLDDHCRPIGLGILVRHHGWNLTFTGVADNDLDPLALVYDSILIRGLPIGYARDLHQIHNRPHEKGRGGRHSKARLHRTTTLERLGALRTVRGTTTTSEALRYALEA